MPQTLLQQNHIILVILLFSLLIHGETHKFSKNLSPKSFPFKKEKISHLHFYFHDIAGGDHPTAVRVAEATVTNTSASLFGAVVMIDDPLTVGPERTSRIVGRAQGLYASADLDEFGLTMVLNYVFIEGKYNGSTLSILGRNKVMSSVREMPIIGGTGLFRFARGYALAKTYSLNFSNGDAVVEYNVYVIHY
ncbi:dirigent protein 21-like [Cynara cardunculus var. scolymus]|uniref:dirigent protein 21-like n=1 Tax=Cynara cardunculus var. scolymus TaxID=59895 RepID=UPI000D62D93A|nr:dirigent protein 21-like [Cynara cardunculus var. scolymus]